MKFTWLVFFGAKTLSRGSTAPASTRNPPCTARATTSWNIHCPASLSIPQHHGWRLPPYPSFQIQIACQKRLFPLPAKRQCSLSFPCLCLCHTIPFWNHTLPSRPITSQIFSLWEISHPSVHRTFLYPSCSLLYAMHGCPAHVAPPHNTNAAQPFLSSGKCGWAISRHLPPDHPAPHSQSVPPCPDVNGTAVPHG